MPRTKAPSVPALRARAHRAPREASLIVLFGTDLGKRVPLPQSTFTIGRSTKSDLFIDQQAVSRHHARIGYHTGEHTIFDLQSSNGVFVNDVRVPEKKLEDGDRIRIGRTLLVFSSGQDVERRQDELHRLMTEDPLTRVYNRRYFHEALEREHGRTGQAPLSVVLFDIDGFDGIQLAESPEAADMGLKQLASAVKVGLGPEDIFGRLGEGSFGLILPGTTLAKARRVAETIRIAALGLAMGGEGSGRKWTVSLGVATTRKGADEGGAEELLARARAELECATTAGTGHAGGNRDRT